MNYRDLPGIGQENARRTADQDRVKLIQECADMQAAACMLELQTCRDRLLESLRAEISVFSSDGRTALPPGSLGCLGARARGPWRRRGAPCWFGGGIVIRVVRKSWETYGQVRGAGKHSNPQN